MSLSAIFVSGLSASGTRWPLPDTGSGGWETNLKADFPGADVHVFTSHLSRAQSPERDNWPWATIPKLARKLKEELENKEDSNQAPLVFFCQGLGGYVVLKALGFLQDGSSSDVALHDRTAAIIFFGTPLNATKETDFRWAIRACATVELETKSKVAKPDEHESRDLANVLRGLESTDATVVSVYEGQPTQFTDKNCLGFSRRPKIVVGKELGGFRGVDLLSSKESHLSVGNFNQATYTHIVDVIQRALQDRSGIAQALPTRPSQEQPTPGSAAVVQAPRMRSSTDEFGPAPIRLDMLASSHPSAAGSTSVGSVATKCHLIEFPENPHFVGRESVLEEITRHLVDSSGAAHQNTGRQDVGTHPSGCRRAFALHAPKGFGKTQTARKFAAKETDHFPYILWVAANEENKLIGTYAKFAARLGLVDDTADFYTASEKLREWFAAVAKPFLVIFDNAQDPVLINSWWPFGAMGSVLVTTLDPSFKTSNVAGNGMALPTIDETDAVKMVLDQVHPGAFSSNTDDDRREAKIIVKRVGCLPLAVQNCVGAINAVERTLKQYSGRYPESGPILEQSSVGNVSRSWAPYAQALKESIQDCLDPLNDNSRALVDVFSLLDPSKIPEQPFDFVGRAIPTDLKGVDFVQPHVYEECIKQLSKGVVMRGSRDTSCSHSHGPNNTSPHDEGSAFPEFHIHDLHCEFLRSDLKKNLGRRQVAFDTATRLVSMTLDASNYPKNVTTRMAQRGLFLEYFSHIESIRKFFESTWEDEEPQRLLRIPASFLTLLHSSSWLCYVTGFFRDGLSHVKTGERILEALEKDRLLLSAAGSQDLDNILVAKMGIFHSSACIATEIGDFSLSLEMFGKQLDVYKQGFGKNVAHPAGDEKKLRRIFGGIANSYQGLGHHLEAEKYYDRCLEEARDQDELHSPFPVNKCRSQWARGAYDDASTELERLVSLREKKYGTNDSEDYIIGHMKYVLGNVRIEQNRFDDAFELHKGSLACWKITMGEQHHKTGDCYHKVGWHHARLGQWDEARGMLEQALAVYKSGKDEGFRHGEIARTSYKLGLVLQELGDFEKADVAMKEARKLRKEVLQKSGRPTGEENAGEDGYDTLVSLWAR